MQEFYEFYFDFRFEIDMMDWLVDLVGEGYELVICGVLLFDLILMVCKFGGNLRVFCVSLDYFECKGKLMYLEDFRVYDCIGYIFMFVWYFKGLDGDIGYQL